jgi:hypothetical protein
MVESLTEHRITALRQKLAARSARDGAPKKGYEKNTAMIKAEIERLERKSSHGNAAE